MESTEDQLAFLADFGVPVVVGATNTTGILDAPGSIEVNGQIISTDHAVRYLTASIPDLDTNDTIAVNGNNYIVRHVLQVGDGVFSIATLKRA